MKKVTVKNALIGLGAISLLFGLFGMVSDISNFQSYFQSLLFGTILLGCGIAEKEETNCSPQN